MFRKAFFAVAIILHACGLAYAGNDNATFKVSNRSGEDICEIYIAPTDDESWGDDLIENLSECLHPGNSVDVRLPKEWSTKTDWEIKLVFSEEKEEKFTASLQLRPGTKANLYAKSADVPGGGVDWSKVPQLGNLREAAMYFRECTEKMMPSIPLAFTNGFLPDAGDLVRGTTVTAWGIDDIENDGTNAKKIYTVTYYAGARVANAYLNNDTSSLTSEEMKLYNEAVSILKNIMKKETELQKEYFIHDLVINRAKYEAVSFEGLAENEIPRGKSALGVLLDHKANCQGFSDAFYMLCRMAGLKAGMWDGQSGGGHTWNTIELNGRTYFVDTTNDQVGFTFNNERFYKYVYFNAPREILQATHSWNRETEPGNLQDEVDENFFYTTKEHYDTDRKYFGCSHDSAKEGLDGLAEGIATTRWRVWYLMVPYDSHYANADAASKYLMYKLTNAYHWGGGRGHINLGITTNKNWEYMFYTVVATIR